MARREAGACRARSEDGTRRGEMPRSPTARSIYQPGSRVRAGALRLIVSSSGAERHGRETTFRQGQLDLNQGAPYVASRSGT